MVCLQVPIIIILGLMGSALSQPQRYRIVPILSKSFQFDPSGVYRSSYQTGDGASVEEIGYLKPTNDGLDRVVAKQGSFSYTSPEGVPVQITYVADEYGFKPQGNVIPVAPQPLPPSF